MEWVGATGKMSPRIRLYKCNSRVWSPKHTHELSEKEKCPLGIHCLAKWGLYWPTSYQAMTEEIPFQGRHQGHWIVECQLLEVKDSTEPCSLLTLTRACPKICPIEVLSTYTEKRVTLWSTRKESDLGLSEVKGLPRILRLPTQLDRGRLDSGILKCELEHLSLGHFQSQLRILWGSSGAMLKTAPLQPITHVPFF